MCKYHIEAEIYTEQEFSEQEILKFLNINLEQSGKNINENIEVTDLTVERK